MRAMFEQPPVLDVILRNIQYENENENDNEGLTQRDIASFGVQDSSLVVGVICGVCRSRGSM
jgi:hypothetical protein